jgi:hypothetical protein
MIPDLSFTTRKHLAIQRESHVGAYTPMRNCTGECKKRKSFLQFTGTSTVCIRCVRRNS